MQLVSDTYRKYEWRKRGQKVRVDHRQQTGKMTFSGAHEEQPEGKEQDTKEIVLSIRSDTERWYKQIYFEITWPVFTVEKPAGWL